MQLASLPLVGVNMYDAPTDWGSNELYDQINILNS